MRIDAFEREMRRNAIIHDQDLFAAPEVIATGRQTLAPSRRALLLELVRIGTLEWTPDVVEAVYGGLNSGVQHAFSVYRGDPAGWPDETAYVRAARADIVDAGMEPVRIHEIAQAFQVTGNPFGIDDARASARPGTTVHFMDASTRALAPEIGEAARGLVRHVCPEAGELAAGTGGYELVDLGLWKDAKVAMNATVERLKALGARTVVTDSPEAVYALNRLATVVGVTHQLEVMHLTEWLAPRAGRVSFVALERRATYHDSSRLGRGLGVFDEPRTLLRAIPELDLVEMKYTREEAIPTGPAHGYPYPDAIPAMGERRLGEAMATSADLLVAASAYSKRNLRAARIDGAPDILDITEVLALALEV
jgi:hypothetical protein